MNRGNLNFEVIAMPWKAQLSYYRDAVVVDANRDSLPDILLVGNYYENNIQMGRYDADYATLLINHGRDLSVRKVLNGTQIKGGRCRHIKKLNVDGKSSPSFILARNNDSTMIIRFGK